MPDAKWQFRSDKMRRPATLLRAILTIAGVASVLLCSVAAFAQAPRPKKVFIETDMEGVDGIFDFEMQCIPWKSPRWAESMKLLADEINAAVDGFFKGEQPR